MKRIVTILFLLVSLASSAQGIVKGRGESNTVDDKRLMASINLFTPIYADTTAANLNLGIDSSGALIWTRTPKSLWIREYTASGVKKWTLYGTGATPPAGSNREIQINDGGSMGASSAFKYTSAGYVDIAYGGLVGLIGADNSATTRTNATAKSAILALPHYNTTEENVMILNLQSFSGSNVLQIGYGNASYNAMSEIRIGVGATATSTTGVEKARITNTGIYIGTGANPSAKLHIEAGTTSLAPLRFTAGTNKTTAAAGEMEYDGTNLYFTPTGTTRKRLAITNNATPSNGQIPIGNGTDYTAANITSSNGSVTVTNGSGTIDLSIPTTTLTSGTYTPTLTGVTNVTSVTSGAFRYVRIGSIVEVTGTIVIEQTAAAFTEIGVSLPIASNFTTGIQCSGVMTNQGTETCGRLIADTTNDRAQIEWMPSGTSSYSHVVKFSYEIL